MASNEFYQLAAKLKSLERKGNIPFKERRDEMEAVAPADKLDDDIICEPVIADGIPAEWISVSNLAEDRVLYYLHGGGYCTGSIYTHCLLISHVKKWS